MSDTALSRGELVVRTIAQTAVDNETYFCELDAVVGDGDFGYSLARGFEIVLSDWDDLGYDDIGGLLKKTALILTKRIGGTSGPIWGTAFLRAGVTLTPTPEPNNAEVIAGLRAAIDGIKQRGDTDLGDKTLLDALVPAVDELEKALDEGAPDALPRAAAVAREAAENTKGMLAQRGRAAYNGPRMPPPRLRPLPAPARNISPSAPAARGIRRPLRSANRPWRGGRLARPAGDKYPARVAARRAKVFALRKNRAGSTASSTRSEERPSRRRSSTSRRGAASSTSRPTPESETVSFRAARFDQAPGATTSTFNLLDELPRMDVSGDLARLAGRRLHSSFTLNAQE